MATYLAIDEIMYNAIIAMDLATEEILEEAIPVEITKIVALESKRPQIMRTFFVVSRINTAVPTVDVTILPRNLLTGQTVTKHKKPLKIVLMNQMLYTIQLKNDGVKQERLVSLVK